MTHLPNAPAPTAILEAALYVDDLEEAALFYGRIMGLQEELRVPGRHVFFRVGQTILLLFDPKVTVEGSSNPRLPVPTHGAHGPGHLCFAATRDEIEQWRLRLEAAGHPVEADFDWPNGARSIYFRDPAGNSIEIAEPRLWFEEG
jgi:catechol 2,3-dioxygenase-like lactoylglutathione lyase family enzyme